MFSNNVLYWLQGPIEVLLGTGKKIVLNKGIYTDKELNLLIGMKLKLRIDDCEDVLRTSKLEKVTKIAISLKELNNSDNLKDGNSAIPYLHIMLLVLNILHALNPTPLNIRPLKITRLLL